MSPREFVRFRAGDEVPVWIERVEPSTSQLRVTFAVDVEVETDATGLVHVWPMTSPPDGRVLNADLPDGVVEQYHRIVRGAPTYLHERSREDEAVHVYQLTGPYTVVDNTLEGPSDRPILFGGTP